MMIDQLKQALHKGFIGRNQPGNLYDPKLIINEPDHHQYLLNHLQNELATAQSFTFSVAFITQAGLNMIKTILADLDTKGIRGRLITSTYLSFNHPDAFESLLNIPNLEVRLSNREGFHAKGYIFQQKDYYSFIIGSSNLTHSALKMNYEWNLRLTSHQHGEIIHQMQTHLEDQWNQSEPLTSEWVDKYRSIYVEEPINLTEIVQEPLFKELINPNRMQREALNSLENLRSEGARRGLVVSATGTGKTYLAAFEARQAKVKRLLFVVHREQILRDAVASFRKILGGPASDYGILSGQQKDYRAKYVFATVQTLSKPENLRRFDPEHFDYIMIDEVHKVGAASYLRLINYFKPQFLLGLTATPERTDDFNLFELFDYNIAYEIRLQEAMEADMLAPFHYFGVTDLIKNGQTISDLSTLTELVMDERVDFILQKLNYYGVSGHTVKGLVFCSRKDEARLLSQAFNQRGVLSEYLVGEHSIEEREAAVARLESGAIEYIFTVDIFNEGIDIPQINQVVMLRQTQSTIIFTQQLGRGLRKHDNKQFLTVIDFIGNYQNNFLIPMALTGDNAADKDDLRRDTATAQFIPGVSAVNFEEIARERIFQAIDSAKLNSMKRLRAAYQQLKMRLNRVPMLIDFETTQTIDAYTIANEASGLKSYYEFVVKMGDQVDYLDKNAKDLLTFYSREILPGHRLHEVVLIKKWLDQPHTQFTKGDLKGIFAEFQLDNSDPIVNNVIGTLTCDFYTGSLGEIYQATDFIQWNDQYLGLTESGIHLLSDDVFLTYFTDIIQVAELNHKEFTDQPLTLYQKYRRRDTLRMLGWNHQMVDQNIGGYTYNEQLKQFVIFVTYHKGEHFAGATHAYEDAFYDASRLHYYSKVRRTMDSPEIKILKEESGWQYHLFVKKSDNNDPTFYYLGQVNPDPNSFEQVIIKDKNKQQQKLVSMDLILEKPLETALYNYITLI